MLSNELKNIKNLISIITLCGLFILFIGCTVVGKEYYFSPMAKIGIPERKRFASCFVPIKGPKSHLTDGLSHRHCRWWGVGAEAPHLKQTNIVGEPRL